MDQRFNHCRTCTCHQLGVPEAAPGERIVESCGGRLGKVLYLQAPNLLWHNGGVPYVQWDDGTFSYCAYYDLVVK